MAHIHITVSVSDQWHSVGVLIGQLDFLDVKSWQMKREMVTLTMKVWVWHIVQLGGQIKMAWAKKSKGNKKIDWWKVYSCIKKRSIAHWIDRKHTTLFVYKAPIVRVVSILRFVDNSSQTKYDFHFQRAFFFHPEYCTSFTYAIVLPFTNSLPDWMSFVCLCVVCSSFYLFQLTAFI